MASAAEVFTRQVDRDERPFDEFVRQAGRGDRARLFNEFVHQAAQRDLREATSWGDLAGRLLRNGLYLRDHDNDLAVTNGEYSVKTSNVAPGVSHAALAQRFGERLVVYRDNEPQPQESAASRKTREAVEPSRPPAPDLRLDAVKRSVDALERRVVLERSRDAAVEKLDRARVQLDPHTAKRAEARDASRRFRIALAEVYRNPVQARQTFYAQVRSEGVTRAAGELSRHPERFGALRGGQVGPMRSQERKEALQNAAKLGHLGGEHLRRLREAWTNRGEYRETRTKVLVLERRLKALDAQLVKGPGSERLKQHLSRQLRALQPAQRKRLYRSLPIPHRGIVAATMAAARAFANEQGHER